MKKSVTFYKLSALMNFAELMYIKFDNLDVEIVYEYRYPRRFTKLTFRNFKDFIYFYYSATSWNSPFKKYFAQCVITVR